MIVCDFEEYFDDEADECVPYVLYFGELEDLLKISIEPNPDADPEQAAIDTDFTYEIITASASEIKVQIYFNFPLKITPLDMLQVQL